MANYVVYAGSDDWSALYENGKLIQVGDHYLVDEKLREIFGVETIQNDDFCLGKENVYYNDVAQTLDEINVYAAEQERLKDEANALEAQAKALLEQAAELRKTH